MDSDSYKKNVDPDLDPLDPTLFIKKVMKKRKIVIKIIRQFCFRIA